MPSTLEKLVQEIGDELKKRNLSLVTAESCTGGGLSYWITLVPGSSDWFERGYVTYSNAAKIDLGVNPLTLDEFGAVSEQTAREMAQSALHHSLADISIAITGIAGPTGGLPHKPVGTVWFAFAAKNAPIQSEVSVFSGNREAIRQQAIEQALSGLLKLVAHLK